MAAASRGFSNNLVRASACIVHHNDTILAIHDCHYRLIVGPNADAPIRNVCRYCVDGEVWHVIFCYVGSQKHVIITISSKYCGWEFSWSCSEGRALSEHIVIAEICKYRGRKSRGCSEGRTPSEHIVITIKCKCRGRKSWGLDKRCATSEHLPIATKSNCCSRERWCLSNAFTTGEQITIAILRDCRYRTVFR